MPQVFWKGNLQSSTPKLTMGSSNSGGGIWSPQITPTSYHSNFWWTTFDFSFVIYPPSPYSYPELELFIDNFDFIFEFPPFPLPIGISLGQFGNLYLQILPYRKRNFSRTTLNLSSSHSNYFVKGLILDLNFASKAVYHWSALLFECELRYDYKFSFRPKIPSPEGWNRLIT